MARKPCLVSVTTNAAAVTVVFIVTDCAARVVLNPCLRLKPSSGTTRFEYAVLLWRFDGLLDGGKHHRRWNPLD
jgi:hypothetical protein